MFPAYSVAIVGIRLWKPGQSGNPGGQTVEYGQVIGLARSLSVRAMERLGELMESPDERVATVACNAILDRAFGKPQPHRDQEPDEFDDMNAEQLRAYLIEKLLGHDHGSGPSDTAGSPEEA